jgi:hypothetical protein
VLLPSVLLGLSALVLVLPLVLGSSLGSTLASGSSRPPVSPLSSCCSDPLPPALLLSLALLLLPLLLLLPPSSALLLSCDCTSLRATCRAAAQRVQRAARALGREPQRKLNHHPHPPQHQPPTTSPSPLIAPTTSPPPGPSPHPPTLRYTFSSCFLRLRTPASRQYSSISCSMAPSDSWQAPAGGGARQGSGRR